MNDINALESLVDGLPELVREKRLECGLSLRDAAIEIGIPFQTLSSIETRVTINPSVRTFLWVLRWLEGRAR